MVAKWVRLALLASALAAPTEMIAQRGRVYRPPPQKPPIKSIVPPTGEPGKGGRPPIGGPGERTFPGVLTEGYRERREVAADLERTTGRRPSEQEITNEIARRRAQKRKGEIADQLARKKKLDDEWNKVVAIERSVNALEQELVSQSLNAANIRVRPATTPPPTNQRIMIRRTDGRGQIEFDRRDLEKRLRELQQLRPRRAVPSEQIGDATFRMLLDNIDTAAFRFANGQLPTRRAIRYFRYDSQRSILSVYNDPSPGAKPERTWVITSDSTSAYELRAFVRASGQVLCYCPEVPAAFRDATADTAIEYVRGVSNSANSTATQLVAAADLGNLRFTRSKVELLDGLPQVRSGVLGLWDTWRMNLNLSDRHEWRKFRNEVALPRDITTVATNRKVLDGLQSGEKDIILVVAHNDGTYVYLPRGERVAIRDVAALKRDVAPDRVVILVTCKGGTPQEGYESLAAIIVQNKLARSVFASDELVDARSLPAMLERLSSGTLRTVLKEFRFDQFVEILDGHLDLISGAQPWIFRPRLPRA